jgi:hypothetical protein
MVVHGFVRVVAVAARLISLNYAADSVQLLHLLHCMAIPGVKSHPFHSNRGTGHTHCSPLLQVKEINMLKPYYIAVALLSAWLALAHAAERKPKECEEATALEGLRESRIEAEFSRRGIFDPLEKINRRAEIESEIDNRIRIVKDICERLLGDQ